MAIDCCNLVGNFDTDLSLPAGQCIISVNSTINTEYPNLGCDPLQEGHTVGSLNISGYAGTTPFKGCRGRAGVQILWTRKYDCGADQLHFIYSGEGRSYSSGDSIPSVTLNRTYSTSTKKINASSQSGPSSLYTDIEQEEGLGMTYTGDPITFDTSDYSGCTMTNMGLGKGNYFLQSFTIEFVPGSIPVANYTFAYDAAK